MMKRARYCLIAMMLAAPARTALAQGAAIPAPDAARHMVYLVVQQEVILELAHLADTARTETVRCLMGVVRGDTTFVDRALTPVIYGSSSATVHYGGCLSAAVAEWHNHPWTTEPRPENVCYLSRADIESALHKGAPLVQVVQVTAEVSCWWLRSQVAALQDRPIVWPMPGQRTLSGATAVSAARQGVEHTTGAGRPGGVRFNKQ